jgi:hypothetical protein
VAAPWAPDQLNTPHGPWTWTLAGRRDPVLRRLIAARGNHGILRHTPCSRPIERGEVPQPPGHCRRPSAAVRLTPNCPRGTSVGLRRAGAQGCCAGNRMAERGSYGADALSIGALVAEATARKRSGGGPNGSDNSSPAWTRNRSWRADLLAISMALPASYRAVRPALWAAKPTGMQVGPCVARRYAGETFGISVRSRYLKMARDVNGAIVNQRALNAN